MTRDLPPVVLRRLAAVVLATLARNTAWVAAVLGSWALVSSLAPAPDVQHAPSADSAIDSAIDPATDLAIDPATDPVAALVAGLVDRHDCWTGDSDRRPRHAVVTLPGDRPRLVRATRGFEIWLDDRPGTLHAFCP